MKNHVEYRQSLGQDLTCGPTVYEGVLNLNCMIWLGNYVVHYSNWFGSM